MTGALPWDPDRRINDGAAALIAVTVRVRFTKEWGKGQSVIDNVHHFYTFDF